MLEKDFGDRIGTSVDHEGENFVVVNDSPRIETCTHALSPKSTASVDLEIENFIVVNDSPVHTTPARSQSISNTPSFATESPIYVILLKRCCTKLTRWRTF